MLEDLIREFRKDPESVSYERIFQVAAREHPDDLIIAPYLTKLQTHLYGMKYHFLQLRLNKKMNCPSLIEGYPGIPSSRLEIGEITGPDYEPDNEPISPEEYLFILGRQEETIYEIPPFFYRIFQFENLDTLPEKVLKYPKFYYYDPQDNEFRGDNSDNIEFEDFILINPQLTVTNALCLVHSSDLQSVENSHLILNTVEYREETREAFFKSIQDRMIAFAEILLNRGFFENIGLFGPLKDIVILPYLFGQENFSRQPRN